MTVSDNGSPMMFGGDGFGGSGFIWAFLIFALLMGNGGFGFGGNNVANAIGYENLATSIPDGTDGAELVISNGTVSASILNGNGNYLRFYPLTSRTILQVQMLNDPLHYQIINVFGRKIKRYA